MTFDIDANGIVNVHARDKGTGKERQIRIQASGGLSEADIQRMVKDVKAHAEEDKKRKAQVEAKNHAEALIHTTEKALSEHGARVSEGERRTIENAIADLKEVLKRDDAAAITAKTNALAQASMKLGEAMYKRTQESSATGSGAGAGGSDMTQAVCFKCGSGKPGFLAPCGQCGVAPRTEQELSLSLVLSLHLSAEPQLTRFSHEIKNGRPVTVPESLLELAREAVDLQLLAMLKIVSTTAKRPKMAHQGEQTSGVEQKHSATANQPLPLLKETVLHRNPFWLLGATTRDDRRHIVDLAEQKLLELDQEACQKARADLTSPRTRLAVEMAWLPGISPKKAATLALQLLQDPMSLRFETGLPRLAHANLLAAAFEAIDAESQPTDIAEFIKQIASIVDELIADDVLRDINEDRAVSEFPVIQVTDQVESELGERKRYFRNAIKEALDRLPSPVLLAAITQVVDDTTAGGKEHAPELIDALVDSYEVETHSFLEQEAENVEKLIKAARNSAKSGEEAIKPLVDKLEIVVRNWSKVALPIQLSSRARGLRDRRSVDLAFSIRSLGIDLFNEYHMLPQSKRITDLLQELFAKLPELVDHIETDANALGQIARDIKELETQRIEWEQQITYSAEIGALFKSTLTISPKGISWQNRTFSLEAITKVRWGGVRHSINGVPTGTSYTIAFGDGRSEAVVDLRREDVFSTFIDKLWRAVGVRLLTELLQGLRAGKEIRVGSAVIRDDGVTLPTHKMWGSAEDVRCTWYQCHIWNADGSFCIGAKENKKAYAALSYIAVPNVHILEQAVRMAFKKPGIRVLSDLIATP